MKGDGVSDQAAGSDEILRPSRHLFLSPHYDDIALSIGGTAKLISSAGRSAEIALIFGDHPDTALPLTQFALDLHTEWGLDADQVIAGRRAEEAAASRILGARDRFLPFRDAIYRGENYTSNTQLFGVPADEEAGLPGQIIDSLLLDSNRKSDTRIYAPLAVGFHVDHQQAFRAGQQLAAEGWEVWFYEDLPYAIKTGSRETRLAKIPFPMTVAARVNVYFQWSAKIDAILSYPSQLTTVFDYVDRGHTPAEIDETMREYALAAGGDFLGERFWRINE